MTAVTLQLTSAFYSLAFPPSKPTPAVPSPKHPTDHPRALQPPPPAVSAGTALRPAPVMAAPPLPYRRRPPAHPSLVFLSLSLLQAHPGCTVAKTPYRPPQGPPAAASGRLYRHRSAPSACHGSAPAPITAVALQLTPALYSLAFPPSQPTPALPGCTIPKPPYQQPPGRLAASSGRHL